MACMVIKPQFVSLTHIQCCHIVNSSSYCMFQIAMLPLCCFCPSQTWVWLTKASLNMLWVSETAMITVFRLGSGWRLTGGETQTWNLADALSAKPFWFMSKLWRDWDKKPRPNLFLSLSSLSFLWPAPVCLSTAEVLATSNQCVHCSLLPSLLSSFFLLSPRPSLSLSSTQSLSFCQTGQILETCIIRSSQDAGGKVDLQRLIESTYPSSLSNPQPATPADRSPMAYLH